MNNLECAKKLKELLTNHKKHLTTGLCKFVSKMYRLGFINLDEWDVLDGFISDNNPYEQKNRIWYSLWHKENRAGYYFEKGNYRRRIKWVNSLIRKYSK